MDTPLAVPGEREPPLYFAGREDELGALGRKLQRLCASGDPAGGLQLTVGVPGVGKTQLARQFVERDHDANALGREIATVLISPESMDSHVDLFKTMAAALDERATADRVTQHDNKVAGATVGVLGARGALAMDIARHTPDLSAMLSESLREGMWDGKALVLAVDEIQRIGAEGMNALCVLHDGLHKCPVMLMGFGLQHTERALANPPGGRGISRIATPQLLAPLNHREALDAFAGNLSQLGYDDVPEDSLDALAKASFGFPQHINGYLDGAHKALRRYGHLHGPALDAALQHGNDRRTSYYNKRLASGNSHAPMLALSAAMDAANVESMAYGDAIAALKAAGFDRSDLDRAIEHGAIVHGDDTLAFGIPSFHAHMARMRERSG